MVLKNTGLIHLSWENTVFSIARHIKNEYAKYGGFYEGRRLETDLVQQKRLPRIPREKELQSIRHELEYMRQELEYLKKNFCGQIVQKIGGLLCEPILLCVRNHRQDLEKQ